MSQRDRKLPVHLQMQRSVNIGLAAKVLRDVLDGKEYSAQRVKVALAVWNKIVPNRDSLSVDVSVQHSPTLQDVNTRLTLAGIQPDQVWEMLQAPDNPGKIIDSEEALEPPPPPAMRE